MNTVIYNPNNIDSILTSAILQTMGWTAFSNREIVDVEKGEFSWVGVVPTRKHFPHKADSDNRHICYGNMAKSNQSTHLILPDVQYAEAVITHMNKDAFLKSSGSATLLDQVSSIENINTSERHFLNNLITSFYKKETTIDIVAITVANVMAALEALESREPFTPIPLPEKGVISEPLALGMRLVKSLKMKTERILTYAATSNHTRSSVGHTRVIRTYESKDWWFIRRSFLPTDIGFNICLSATGANVDTTLYSNFDIGVQDPVIVVS